MSMTTLQKLRWMIGKTIKDVIPNSIDPDIITMTFTDGTSIRLEAEDIGHGCADIVPTIVNRYPDPSYD